MNIRVHSLCAIDDTYVISVQGCLKKCDKCNNVDHSISVRPICGGEKCDTEYIKKQIALDPRIKKILLTGGEPFLQPQACIEIASWAKFRGYKVHCQSGYSFDEILEWEDNRRVLLENIDILELCPYLVDSAALKPECFIDVQERLKKIREDEEAV